MKNGKVTLLAVATMAAVAITAQGVQADEVQGTTITGDQPSGITVEKAGEIGKIQDEGTQLTEQGNSENLDEKTESGNRFEEKAGNSTEFVKHDNIIQVTNPERSQKSSQKTLHRACLYARNLMLGLRTVTGS